MNVAEWLYRTALARPDTPALRLGCELHATYETFANRSAQIGEALKQAGVARGDRVALFIKNSPEYLELLYGIWWIGAVAVPINAKLHPAEASWIVQNARACVLVSETALPAHLVEGVTCWGLEDLPRSSAASGIVQPASLAPNEIAWLFYTSGTTGKPKGVMLSHRNLVSMSYAYALDVDAVSVLDNALYVAPMSHGAGLYNFPFVRAGACHVVPESHGFEPQEILDLSARLGNVSFFAAPTMVKRLVECARQSGQRGDGIRTVIYGGGPMYGADIDDALAQFGSKFVQIYGQGESPMTITVLPRDIVADESRHNWRIRRTSVGFAQACVSVRVVDAEHRDVPLGETGEIMVSGDTVMMGYWDNPAATAETLLDGWLKTGDMGRLDAEGFLTLTDRSKDVVISGGTNIYPREVEEVILRHEAVQEVAVIGTTDREWGERVVAFIVLGANQDCTVEELEDWCRSHMAGFKRPKQWEFLSALPKNNYGKVLKTDLRAMIDEGGPRMSQAARRADELARTRPELPE